MFKPLALDEELIWYLTWRVEREETRAAKTRLVKLLYLVDLRHARREGRQATSFTWRFYHYGPYPFGVEEAIEHQLGRTIDRLGADSFYGESVQIFHALEEPPDDLLPSPTQIVADQVCREWGYEDLNVLLSYVYFDTPPMRHAQRGDVLDLTIDADEQWPRYYRPLDPPDVNERLRKRFSDWRHSFDRRFPIADLATKVRHRELSESVEGDAVYGQGPEDALARFRMTIDPELSED